ncbi:MAG: DUF3887 domain-containing protein [Candidatus Saccharibacteria bacterium]
MRSSKLGIFLILALCLLILPGCDPEALGESAQEARAFADPAAEQILQGISNNNYEQFSKYFSGQLKMQITKERFDKNNPKIRKAMGTYVSKSFMTRSVNEGVDNIMYKVVFSDEPATTYLQMKYKVIDGQDQVTYVQLLSPKMAKLMESKK